MTTVINGIPIVGDIEQSWLASGGINGPLGAPTGPEIWAFDNVGRTQGFVGGVIAWHPREDIRAHYVLGPISRRWVDGGSTAYLGFPVVDQGATRQPGGAYCHFRAPHLGNAEASIFWHPAFGAHLVVGAFRDKWGALEWDNGRLGFPVRSEDTLRDGIGKAQAFSKGIVVWHPETGARALFDDIGLRWNQSGETGYLGYPVTDDAETGDGGRFAHFRKLEGERAEASIFWRRDTGAWEIIGGIRQKYAELDWNRSPLGYPVRSQDTMVDGVGKAQAFSKGIVVWHPNSGARVLYGEIGQRWHTTGGTAYLGYPITDDSPTGDGGRYAHFRKLDGSGVEASIFWLAGTGAWEIIGGIREFYASLDWNRGALGYPTAAEKRNAGDRIQDFERGRLRWSGTVFTTTPDWILFRRTITTGSALGGSVELKLERNGDVAFSGRMRSSGADSYMFMISAYLQSGAGLLFATQTSGEVQGLIDGLTEFDLKPEREAAWDIRIVDKVIAADWNTINWNSFSTELSYESGIGEFVSRFIEKLIDYVVTNALLGPVAGIRLIGKEVAEIHGIDLPTVGLPWIPGLVLVGGISLITGPGLLIPVYVAGMAVTALTAKSRRMTDYEYELAEIVFGAGTLPDRQTKPIIITNLTGVENAAFTVEDMDGTSVLVNLGSEYYDKIDQPSWVSSSNLTGQLFIHELVHAWQIARSGSLIKYVGEKAVSANSSQISSRSPQSVPDFGSS